ncbi:MAG TPA: pyridoxamine 5'-phosphate oxidase [bacterium]|nr:pyridoxamine 5'-phosphate oxidase [bacterium]
MPKTSIPHLRREYRGRPLLEKGLPARPLPLFEKWFAEAVKARLLDANACTVSTLTASSRPASRTVLLKGVDAQGLSFFTNYESQKGRELARRPYASLLLLWRELFRQVRVDGRVVKVSAAESDAYFKTRPRGSQLGAWASDQSRAIPDRAHLEARLKYFEREFKGMAVPRPPHWGGYRVLPDLVEFWQGRENRLHDRVRYKLARGRWKRERLSP